MKTCPHCKNTYSATPEIFGVDMSRYDGLGSYCKPCRREIRRAAYIPKSKDVVKDLRSRAEMASLVIKACKALKEDEQIKRTREINPDYMPVR